MYQPHGQWQIPRPSLWKWPRLGHTHLFSLWGSQDFLSKILAVVDGGAGEGGEQALTVAPERIHWFRARRPPCGCAPSFPSALDFRKQKTKAYAILVSLKAVLPVQTICIQRPVPHRVGIPEHTQNVYEDDSCIEPLSHGV